MKYDHIVVAYGKYYAAGEEVPDSDPHNPSINYASNKEKEIQYSDEDIELETTPSKRGRPKKTSE